MPKNSGGIFRHRRGRNKKKLEKYSLAGRFGFAHKVALIRFFYHKDVENMELDEFCKLESELKWLIQMKLIPHIQFE